MWKRWLAFIGRCSGPDLYLLIGTAGALLFVAGGEIVGTAATLLLITLVLGSVRAAHRRGLDRYELVDGTGICFACRGTFSLGDMRQLSRYVALLGPSTWVARQNAHCKRCARRQEIMVATLILLIVGVGAAMLVDAMKTKGH